MDKLKAIFILAGVATPGLRIPTFHVFVNIYFSAICFSLEGEIWSLYGLYLAILMLTLRQDQLFKLYWYLTAGILQLYLPLKYGMEVPEPTLDDFSIILCSAHSFLALYLSERTWKATVLMENILPVAVLYIGLSPHITNSIYSITAPFIICYLIRRIYLSLCSPVENIGQYIVAKPEEDLIQQLIMLFWIAMFAYRHEFPVKGTAYVDWIMLWSDWITFLSTCFEKCCRTPVGLLAASVVVARATSYARLLLETFLYGFRRTGRHLHDMEGIAEGLYFFILSINYGVVKEHHIDAHLDVQRRLFLFQVTVFLDKTYQLLDSEIVSFSSSTEILNHIRALMTYIFFLFPSFWVIYTVCELTSIETALALSCLPGSTIIIIVGSLLVYILSLFKVKYPMENLDETIFYIRALVKLLHIAGSVIGAFSGLCMVIIEGPGWTPCLIIHIYNMYDVWKKYTYEYNAFISLNKRSTKLNCLRWATKREVRNHDDVCSICYDDMTNAKVTPCGHFYHEDCLEKWISDHNSCPLCFSKIRD